MRRALHIGWVLLALGLLLGYPFLPEQVGDPGKQASRAVFAGLMGFVALHSGLCSHHFILWLGRRAPDLINLPHKEHWFAPEQREASLQRLATHVSGLGVQLCLLVAGLYAWPIAEAQFGPLPPEAGWAGAGALGLLFLSWVRAQFRLFPKPPMVPADKDRQPRRPDKRIHGQP